MREARKNGDFRGDDMCLKKTIGTRAKRENFEKKSLEKNPNLGIRNFQTLTRAWSAKG